jgi:hypothetical protein
MLETHYLIFSISLSVFLTTVYYVVLEIRLYICDSSPHADLRVLQANNDSKDGDYGNAIYTYEFLNKYFAKHLQTSFRVLGILGL